MFIAIATSMTVIACAYIFFYICYYMHLLDLDWQKIQCVMLHDCSGWKFKTIDLHRYIKETACGVILL